MVVSKIFYFHPYLGKIPILTIIFFEGVETTNQHDLLTSMFVYFVGVSTEIETGISVRAKATFREDN